MIGTFNCGVVSGPAECDDRGSVKMMSPNWTNKWVMMLVAGIVVQAIAYPTIWALQLFATAPTHEYFLAVFVIGAVSVVVQTVGLGVIMVKTHGVDPAIYGQGRPFQHKLREEDEEVATRKPTYAR